MSSRAVTWRDPAATAATDAPGTRVAPRAQVPQLPCPHGGFLYASADADVSKVLTRTGPLANVANFDPMYFLTDVDTFGTLNLLLAILRIFATYARHMFAVVDALSAMRVNSGGEGPAGYAAGGAGLTSCTARSS